MTDDERRTARIEARRRYELRHPERVRASHANAQRRYRLHHPDRVRVSFAKWLATNHERKLADGREYSRRRYADDPDRRQYQADWRRTPKGKALQARLQCLRRARLVGAVGHATTAQIDARVAYYGGRCWMCGEPGGTLDHVIP